jgi:hypothetical protein
MSVGSTNLMVNETEYGRNVDDLFNVEKSIINVKYFFSLLHYE